MNASTCHLSAYAAVSLLIGGVLATPARGAMLTETCHTETRTNVTLGKAVNETVVVCTEVMPADLSSRERQPTFDLGEATCPAAARTFGLDPDDFCSADSSNEPLEVSDAQILRAMQRLDWPESKLVIQPPDGLTLVNFDTNFYTTSTQPITRRVTLLGQPITIEATPAEYRWHFGDDESLTTTEPGAPYPELTVTHSYRRTGTYRATLDTVYSGRYRVGDGPWRAIPGTVTIPGTAQAIRAIEAQPRLVGYDR